MITASSDNLATAANLHAKPEKQQQQQTQGQRQQEDPFSSARQFTAPSPCTTPYNP
jgi:hypothetical protein